MRPRFQRSTALVCRLGMQSKPAGIFLLVAALGGCAESQPPKANAPEAGQTYAQAIATLCDVDRLAALSSAEDPLGIGQKRSAWLADHIDNPDGIYFRTMISVKAPEEQAAAIREQATKTGLSRCTLADTIENEGTAGIAP